MKKVFTFVCALGLAFTLTAAAEACTATSVMERAEANRDSETYQVAKQVVTETIAGEQEWQSEDATEAAVGTLIREDMELNSTDWARNPDGTIIYEEDPALPGYLIPKPNSENSQLTNTSDARDLLERDSFSLDNRSIWGQMNTVGNDHTYVTTVRDHATLHGQQWEDSVDGVNPSPWVTNPPPTDGELIDHAG